LEKFRTSKIDVINMADLKPIGRILGVIGGIVMIVVGIIIAVNNVLQEALLTLDLLGANFVGDTVGGDLGWVISTALMIVCGLIAIFGYQKLASRDKGDLLLWGFIYIVVGFVGWGLGGILVLIAGIILLIDYFI
jgi:hypothetical protein